MGLFNWLSKMFGGGHAETPDEIADRIERAGDRFRNAGDRDGEQAASVAAGEARRATSVAAATQIEQDFYRSRGLRPDGRPLRPLVGQVNDRGYVRYGSSVRSGGSTGWRYNNPGYLRCNDRSTSYGAIGCDGTYAIFPDEQVGMSAFQQHLRTEYPNTPIEEALRQQLPATEADAAASGLRTAGVDVSKPAGQMTPTEIEQITKECSGVSGSNSGEVFDRGAESPEWVESLWSPTSEAGSDSDSGPSVTSDNS